MSSSTRSITVCSRRAPMFSTVELTDTATSAMASIASSLKVSVTPSVAISATYCLIGEVEGARRDEQDMVGLHRPMLGRHRGAFDQRQEVALHALARHVGAHAALARRDLVDLVEKHDAVILDRVQRLLHQLLLVEQL